MFIESRPSSLGKLIGDNVRPSIASLVGSMDKRMFRYAATIRVQTARTETITDLIDMTVELLKTFYQS